MPREDRTIRQSQFPSRLGGAVLIALLALVAYSSSLRGGFIWDDDDYVQNNLMLRSGRGLWLIWTEPAATPQYYPLVHSSFWIEYQLWGPWPMGFKLVNLGLHLASALLLWRILRKLAVPGAFVAAAVWAIHPVNVESVAWITERKNVLSGLFYLMSLAAYLRFDELRDLKSEISDSKSQIQNPTSKIQNPPSPPRWYVLALLLFACALLSKTVTATLPAVVGLLLWRRHGRLNWRMVAPLIPMLLIGAAMGLLTAWLERAHVGAIGREFDWTRLQRLMIAGSAPLFYLWKLIWPADLSFIYPRWRIDQWGPAHLAAPAALALALLALGLFRRRIGLGPFIALACFLVTLFPALGFLNVYPMRYSFVADHFQYLASIAPIALITAAAASWLPRARAIRRAVPAAVLAALCILTFRQGRIYESRRTIFTDAMHKNPNSWMVRTNLGNAIRDEVVELRAKGQRDQAALLEREAHQRFEEAVALAPDLPETWWNAGIVHLERGDLPAAEKHFRKALQIDAAYAPAYYSLGNMAKDAGRLDEAADLYRAANRYKPNYVDALFALGAVQEKQNNVLGAIESYRAALSVDDTRPKIQYNLANCYRATMQLDAAIAHFQAAVSLDANYWEAWMNLGVTLQQTGQSGRARYCYQQVLRIRPDFAPARQALDRLP